MVPNPIHGQPWSPTPPQLNLETIRPPPVTSRDEPEASASPYSLILLKNGPGATRELPTSIRLLILLNVTSWPRWTCEARIRLNRPRMPESLVPKLIRVRRRLRWDTELTQHCLLMTCRCLWDSLSAEWRPWRWTPRWTRPQHLSERLVMKLLTATWAPNLFKPRNLPSPLQAVRTFNLLKMA